MKKITIFAIILIAIMTLASCTKDGLLLDTDTLKVERDGTITTIYDLAGDKEYSFRSQKIRKDKVTDEMKSDRETVDTDTIKITILYGGGFIVEDKTADIVYRVEKNDISVIPGSTEPAKSN